MGWVKNENMTDLLIQTANLEDIGTKDLGFISLKSSTWNIFCPPWPPPLLKKQGMWQGIFWKTFQKLHLKYNFSTLITPPAGKAAINSSIGPRRSSHPSWSPNSIYFHFGYLQIQDKARPNSTDLYFGFLQIQDIAGQSAPPNQAIMASIALLLHLIIATSNIAGAVKVSLNQNKAEPSFHFRYFTFTLSPSSFHFLRQGVAAPFTSGGKPNWSRAQLSEFVVVPCRLWNIYLICLWHTPTCI